MAYTNGWYDWWESDECSDDSLTGQCDGYVPEDDPDAPGAECRCACHTIWYEPEDAAMYVKWHSDKHRDMQDGAFHNIGFSG